MSYGYTAQPNTERSMVQVGTRLTQRVYQQLQRTEPEKPLATKVREAIERYLREATT